MPHSMLAMGVLLLALTARQADAWQVRVGSNLHLPGSGVAIDSLGNVVGSTERRVGTARVPVVVKLSAERGRPLWRHRFGDFGGGWVRTLATRADDDVIAVLQLESPSRDVAIVRLAAEDGSLVWRHDVPIAATSTREGLAGVTVGPTGDVFVAAGIDDQIVVLALRGTDGIPRWQAVLAPRAQFVVAIAIAAAPDGDVVVTGDTSPLGAVVARLDGGTGATRWTRDFPHLGSPDGLAVDRDGSVAVGARFSVGGLLDPAARFVVVLLDPAGEPIWERRLEPASDRTTGGYADATAFLPDGDVVANGSVDEDVATVRLARTTGDVVWRHHADGEPGLLAQMPDGDVVLGAGVFSARTCWDFVLLTLSSSSGIEVDRRRVRGRAANDRTGCSSGVNDDGLRGLAVSDRAIAIAARVGDPRGPRRLIASFPVEDRER